ncbi:hypothetical protein DXZ75_28395 [Streptomyces sp. AcE210]|nr:hypothetical protein DXZ75_28395 [Streptomyces sp. AcE210]
MCRRPDGQSRAGYLRRAIRGCCTRCGRRLVVPTTLRYARPGVGTVGRHVAERDPVARRRRRSSRTYAGLAATASQTPRRQGLCLRPPATLAPVPEDHPAHRPVIESFEQQGRRGRTAERTVARPAVAACIVAMSAGRSISSPSPGLTPP